MSNNKLQKLDDEPAGPYVQAVARFWLKGVNHKSLFVQVVSFIPAALTTFVCKGIVWVQKRWKNK